MKIFVRIALVIAILACIGSLIFANKLGIIRDGLKKDKENLTADKNRLTKDLADTRTELGAKKQELAKTQEDLNTANANLQAKTVELTTKTQEVEGLKTQVAEKAKELETTKAELASTQATLTQIKEVTQSDDFKNIGQIKERLTAQADENKILGQQLLAMRNERILLKDRITDLSTTPVNLRGKVAAVEDVWGFVVLDLGREQRVQTNTSFLVYRDTKMVSKVQVRTVGQTTSVAEVLPEFNRSAPRVGDLVVH